VARGSELSHPRQDWSALRLVLGAQVPAGRRGSTTPGLLGLAATGPQGQPQGPIAFGEPGHSASSAR